MIKGNLPQRVRYRFLQPNDEDFIPYTRTHRFTFARNFQPPLEPGLFLQELLEPYVETQRVVIRMAYERTINQMNRRGDSGRPVSYRKNNFYFRSFNEQGTVMALDSMLESFMNSNEEFEWENLTIYVVNGLNGELVGAGGGGSDEDEELSADPAGIFKIPRNAQSLCGFIAIVCHLKKFENPLKSVYSDLYTQVVNKYSKAATFPHWIRSIRTGLKLINTAKELIEMLEVDSAAAGTAQMFTLMRHGDSFVQKFPKFRIIVVDQNCKVLGDMCGHEFIQTHVETEDLMDEYCLTLLFKDGHFDLIFNLTKFYRKRYGKSCDWFYCNACLNPYARNVNNEVPHLHTCNVVRCSDCKKPFVDGESLKRHQIAGNKLSCSKCEHEFLGDECFEYHARRCAEDSKRRRCDQCYKFYVNIEIHQCNGRSKKRCLFCEKMVADYANHHCRAYIQKLEMPEESLTADKIWAFDIECTTVLKDGKDVHVPNLIMARKLSEEFVHKFDTVDEFMEFLTEFDEDVTLFAHNFGGYDGRVLFKYFVKHPKLRMVNAIPNGSKFMAYTFTNGNTYLTEQGLAKPVMLRFKDSYRHMSQSLRSLPKTYGLNEELFVKGFYPHSFNKPENRYYKGPLPARETFHPDEMRDGEKHDFEKWYTAQELAQQEYRQETGLNDFYDHYLEFVKYCESDVNVLAEALLVYMQEYMDQCNGLNPLERVTIASHCMRHYLTNHLTENTIPQLKPLEFIFAKEAFFGGRTHPCSLLVENSRIGYVDVNSLYPAVMVNCPLPTGDLKFKRFDTKLDRQQLMQMHGILEVDIRPTKYLHHAIFPIRDLVSFTNSYPLQPLQKIKCTSIEVHKALENGYEVDFVYSALLTDVSYDLFKSYIYEAQTAKLLASGPPKEFETEEGKRLFIEEYKREMGVDLTGMKFEKNAGKRATAKLTNNSLWGKFGENSTRMKMSKYELVKDGQVQQDDADRYNELMSEIFDGKQLFCQNFTYTVDDSQVCYMFTREINDGYNKELKNTTNVMLCAFVTANARMVLWDAMNKLGDRVLYCDTDSIIYLLDDNPEMNIKSSSKLGEWKDECEGDVITDFVSIAPKSYAYKMSNGEVVVKCKGVTLNHENSNIVNFDSMKALVVGTQEKLKTRHLMFDCSKANEFEINTLYREKATSLNRNMLKGELLMKDNEWNLNLPRDYMIFPTGFEDFIQDVQTKYPHRHLRQ